MRILLDERLPLDFRHSFPGHDAHTAQWAGLKGKKNCELVRAAELAGHDVLLTVDQGTPHQLSPAGRKLSVILGHSRTNQMENLLPTVDAILQALETIERGQIVPISSPDCQDSQHAVCGSVQGSAMPCDPEGCDRTRPLATATTG